MHTPLNIVVTGSAGFLGTHLIQALLTRGYLTDSQGVRREIGHLYALDRVMLSGITDPRLRPYAGDLSDDAWCRQVLPATIDSVFHLAAVVSSQAEQEFDLGMRVNVAAFQGLLNHLRVLGTRPKLVTTSSVAVFGGALPVKVPDSQVWMPQSSYGMQKALCDLLAADYSRRGWIDGRTLRMPTIVVRPGRSNAAASSFASAIIREPLQGEEAICPVSMDSRLWLLSPRRAIDALILGHELPEAHLDCGRIINLDGLSVTVREMIDALCQVAGESVTRHIHLRPDPAVTRIVNSWPGDFDASYARRLGFSANRDFSDIVREYIADHRR